MPADRKRRGHSGALRLIPPPPERGILPFRVAKREFERAYLLRVLAVAEWNISLAAVLAGKDRKDFYDVMRRCGVVRPGARSREDVARAKRWGLE